MLLAIDRVASIADGVRTNYLTASAGGLPSVLMEYDAEGQVAADYTYGLGLVAATRNGREGFYHADAIGSTRAITDSVGWVTDRYTYDAFGGLLNQTGTFGNSFEFAGEQRDGSTGLDYMRARYYDPSLGRFISKDAFSGFLSDPYSQHDYQYAHANPVRFTDPTGYFTMGDVMGTIGVASQLAAIGGTAGGIGFGTGYIGAAAASGASGEEILGMFGDWGAGFASGVSGGFLTDMYALHSGSKFEPTHGALWSAGAVTGIGVSFLLGMKLPLVAAASTGPLKWVATAGIAADKGFDVYGAATATGNLYNSYQDNGGWEFQDSWNLLAYLPFVGMTKGVRQGLNVSRKTPKLATPAADDVLANSKKMTGGAGGGPQCFVAGTEILTVDGIKNIEDIRVGDWVIADDPTTPGGIEAKEVLDTFENEATELYDLYVDGEVISTTGEHPFWVPDKGWVKASDLAVGSLLQTDEEMCVDVDKIERREGNFKVYNFEVEGFPTYFVSELGILVHNTCIPPYRSRTKMYELTYERFEWDSVGDVSRSPSIVVGKGEPGQLMLSDINKRGFADGIGAVREMIKQTAQGIGLARPTKITASNVVEPKTEIALGKGMPPEDTFMGKFLQKTARKMGGTPTNVRWGKPQEVIHGWK